VPHAPTAKVDISAQVRAQWK
jgi:hypothetical protein